MTSSAVSAGNMSGLQTCMELDPVCSAVLLLCSV